MPAKPNRDPAAGYELIVSLATPVFKAKYGHDKLPGLLVVAVRGYWRDTIGKPGRNDLNEYDDAFFVLDTKAGSCKSFNGNTDPTRYGWNQNAGKFMARLKPGCYVFRSLYHKKGKPSGHPAFGQAGDVTVERIREDGTIEESETGQFGIHDHCGGNTVTSSEGCLTHPKEDWPAYHAYLTQKLDEHDLADGYTLILLDGPVIP